MADTSVASNRPSPNAHSLRLTVGTMQILAAFLNEPNRWWWPYDLAQTLHLSRASVFLALRRLTDEYGWLESIPEPFEEAGTHPGLPRTYYELTPEGTRQALEMLRPLQLVEQARRGTE